MDPDAHARRRPGRHGRRTGPARLRTALLAALAAAAAGAAAGPARAAAPDAGVHEGARADTTSSAAVVYLVRHAETAGDDPRDPGLSAAGQQRARRLARVLGDAGIDRVYSTPFRRTLGTARPVAEALGLEVRRYDPRERATMEALLRQLRTEGGRALVVGHSNTTPELVRALGADPGPPIAEDEHDRLYVVHLADGSATASLLRYGRRGPPERITRPPRSRP